VGFCALNFPTLLLFTPLEKILFVLLSLMLAAIIWSTLHVSQATLAVIFAGIPLVAGFLLLTSGRDQ